MPIYCSFLSAELTYYCSIGPPPSLGRKQKLFPGLPIYNPCSTYIVNKKFHSTFPQFSTKTWTDLHTTFILLFHQTTKISSSEQGTAPYWLNDFYHFCIQRIKKPTDCFSARYQIIASLHVTTLLLLCTLPHYCFSALYHIIASLHVTTLLLLCTLPHYCLSLF
jgi:hypothetical protein